MTILNIEDIAGSLTIVKLAVTAIGRPSGMKATATETQSTMRVGTEIQEGYAFLSQAALS